MSTTTKDVLFITAGGIASWLLWSLASFYISPPIAPCGFDGQPDAHWQAEFNKLEEKYKKGER